MFYRDIQQLNVYITAGVREMFEKTGFFDMLDREKLFPTIHDAVLHTFQAQKKVRLYLSYTY